MFTSFECLNGNRAATVCVFHVAGFTCMYGERAGLRLDMAKRT